MSSSPKNLFVAEPLRVYHIISGDLWAGAETQVFQLLRALHDLTGVNVRVATMNPGILAEKLTDLGVPVDIFCEERESPLRIARHLFRICKAWRPDIVHTHRRKEHILGGLVALRCRAPAVATIHGLREFSHPWWDFRQSTLLGLERSVLRHLHKRVVAVSHELASHNRGNSGRTVVIPNGIDVDVVRGMSSGERPNLPGRTGRRIAFLGRLVPVKQVDRIIEAVALLHTKEIGAWSLFIIGEGPQQDALKKRVKEVELQEYVHFLGFLTNPLPWLAYMDVLVFASLHEGLPMTALESLAVGVPVVSPAVGGLPDLISEAGLGLIAGSSEPADLADAIVNAVIDINIGGAHRPSAVPPRYTISSSAEAHVYLYSEVARENCAG